MNLQRVHCVHLCIQGHCQLVPFKQSLWLVKGCDITLPPETQSLISYRYFFYWGNLFYQPCLSSFSSYFCLAFLYVFFRIMFHLVSATSMALTLCLFSHRLRAKGKWRIVSVQTPMLQKAFNSTNWTHTQRSCQAKLLSHVKDQWGGRKTPAPLLSVYANRRGKRGGKNRVIEQNGNCAVMQTKKA